MNRGRVALAAALVLTVTGCAAGAPEANERDLDVVALLDQDTGEIVMPIDDYMFEAHSDITLVNRALAVEIGACMEAQGLAFTSDDVVEDPQTTGGDRTYGLWDVERAERFGFGFAPSLVEQAFNADAAAGGDAWLSQYDDCATEAQAEATYLPSNEFLNDSLASEIRTAAYNAALEESEWTDARADWQLCLEEVGLTPGGEDEQWTSMQALNVEPTSEEAISIATREAQCNVDTRLTQRLATLVASYQQPLIDENEAALNELLTERQRLLDTAQEIIDTQG